MKVAAAESVRIARYKIFKCSTGPVHAGEREKFANKIINPQMRWMLLGGKNEWGNMETKAKTFSFLFYFLSFSPLKEANFPIFFMFHSFISLPCSLLGCEEEGILLRSLSCCCCWLRAGMMVVKWCNENAENGASTSALRVPSASQKMKK